jgi:F-type H+-transporting ATPase subunit delta
MRSELLVKRYTDGLAAALPGESEYRTVFGEIEEFQGILQGYERLRVLLLRPFVSSTKKAGIVEEILQRQKYGDKTRRFLLLLIEHRRLGLLPEIIRTLPPRWKELHGIQTFEVLSVVPLADGQKKRLEEELSRLEKGPVSCSYAQNPEIIGGLFIRKGNRVYDASVKGGIERLKEIIGERVPQNGD